VIPDDEGSMVLRNSGYHTTSQHGATVQNIATSVFIAVKTSSLTTKGNSSRNSCMMLWK